MISKKNNIQLEWKEPFQFKKWKLKDHIVKYGRLRYFGAYLLIYILSSALFAAILLIVEKYISHSEPKLLKIIGSSLFISLILCFLFFIAAFDTTKIKIGKKGISHLQGGEWTEYEFSKIVEYNIDYLNDSVSVLKLKLNTGDEIKFGIKSKISSRQIMEIIDSYIEKQNKAL